MCCVVCVQIIIFFYLYIFVCNFFYGYLHECVYVGMCVCWCVYYCACCACCARLVSWLVGVVGVVGVVRETHAVERRRGERERERERERKRGKRIREERGGRSTPCIEPVSFRPSADVSGLPMPFPVPIEEDEVLHPQVW